MQPNDPNLPKDTDQNLTQNPEQTSASPATAPAIDATPVSEPTQVQPSSPLPNETTEDTPASTDVQSPVGTVVSPQDTTTSEEVAPAATVSPTSPESVSTNTEPVTEIQPAASNSSDTTAAMAPAAVVTGATVTQSANAGGKKKKISLLVAVIIVVIVLVGGAAGAYFGVYLPNQPDRIAEQALSNTLNSEKLTSNKFEGEVSFSGGEVSKVISGVTFEGSANNANASEAKVTIKTAINQIGLDVKSTDGKTIYLKLSGLAGLDKLLPAIAGGQQSTTAALLPQLAPLLGQLNDKWFFIDETLAKQALGGNPLSSDQKLSAADAERVKDLYGKNPFLNINKRLDDQKIHDVDSYHVQATIDKNKLDSFLRELKAANIKALPISQDMIDQLSKADLSKQPFDLWIGKKERYITQLSTTVEDKGTSYKLRIAIYDFNKPVNVEKPADAKSVLELLGQVSPLLMGGLGASQVGNTYPTMEQAKLCADAFEARTNNNGRGVIPAGC